MEENLSYNFWDEIDLRDLFDASRRSSPGAIYRKIADVNPATDKEIAIPGASIYFRQNDVLDLSVKFNSKDAQVMPVHHVNKIVIPFHKFYLTYTQAVNLEMYIGRVPNFFVEFEKQKTNYSYPLAATTALVKSATIGQYALIDYILIETFGNLVITNDAGTRTFANLPAGTILENIDFLTIVNSTSCDIEIIYRRR